MNAARNINIHSLQENARKSEEQEAFVVLAKVNDCRIGVGVRLELLAEPTFFIEVHVNLCANQDLVDLDLMESKLSLLKQLGQNEYVLNCNEDCYVSCELVVQSENLNAVFKKTCSEIESLVLKSRD